MVYNGRFSGLGFEVKSGEGKTGHGSFPPYPTGLTLRNLTLLPSSPGLSFPALNFLLPCLTQDHLDFLSTCTLTREWKIPVLINPLGNNSSLCPTEDSALKRTAP